MMGHITVAEICSRNCQFVTPVFWRQFWHKLHCDGGEGGGGICKAKCNELRCLLNEINTKRVEMIHHRLRSRIR
jgi:hypothetical protein